MSMQVSFRVKNLKGGEATGAVSHDLRKKIPGYVDRSRTGQNAVLDGGPPDVPDSIASQGERVKARTGKKLRQDANLFLSGILTFSRDARDRVNATPPDQQAREFAEKFAVENGSISCIWSAIAMRPRPTITCFLRTSLVTGNRRKTNYPRRFSHGGRTLPGRCSRRSGLAGEPRRPSASPPGSR